MMNSIQNLLRTFEAFTLSSNSVHTIYLIATEREVSVICCAVIGRISISADDFSHTKPLFDTAVQNSSH
jgi:hypothetical protein